MSHLSSTGKSPVQVAAISRGRRRGRHVGDMDRDVAFQAALPRSTILAANSGDAHSRRRTEAGATSSSSFQAPITSVWQTPGRPRIGSYPFRREPTMDASLRRAGASVPTTARRSVEVDSTFAEFKERHVHELEAGAVPETVAGASEDPLASRISIAFSPTRKKSKTDSISSTSAGQQSLVSEQPMAKSKKHKSSSSIKKTTVVSSASISADSSSSLPKSAVATSGVLPMAGASAIGSIPHMFPSSSAGLSAARGLAPAFGIGTVKSPHAAVGGDVSAVGGERQIGNTAQEMWISPRGDSMENVMFFLFEYKCVACPLRRACPNKVTCSRFHHESEKRRYLFDASALRRALAKSHYHLSDSTLLEEAGGGSRHAPSGGGMMPMPVVGLHRSDPTVRRLALELVIGTCTTVSKDLGDCGMLDADGAIRLRYSEEPCLQVKPSGTWLPPSRCMNGDKCHYSHTLLEQMYHPNIYKTSMCIHFTSPNGNRCHFGYYCTHAHGHSELRFSNATASDGGPPDGGHKAVAVGGGGDKHSRAARKRAISDSIITMTSPSSHSSATTPPTASSLAAARGFQQHRGAASRRLLPTAGRPPASASPALGRGHSLGHLLEPALERGHGHAHGGRHLGHGVRHDSHASRSAAHGRGHGHVPHGHGHGHGHHPSEMAMMFPPHSHLLPPPMYPPPHSVFPGQMQHPSSFQEFAGAMTRGMAATQGFGGFQASMRAAAVSSATAAGSGGRVRSHTFHAGTGASVATLPTTAGECMDDIATGLKTAAALAATGRRQHGRQRSRSDPPHLHGSEQCAFPGAIPPPLPLSPLFAGVGMDEEMQAGIGGLIAESLVAVNMSDISIDSLDASLIAKAALGSTPSTRSALSDAQPKAVCSATLGRSLRVSETLSAPWTPKGTERGRLTPSSVGAIASAPTTVPLSDGELAKELRAEIRALEQRLADGSANARRLRAYLTCPGCDSDRFPRNRAIVPCGHLVCDKCAEYGEPDENDIGGDARHNCPFCDEPLESILKLTGLTMEEPGTDDAAAVPPVAARRRVRR